MTSPNLCFPTCTGDTRGPVSRGSEDFAPVGGGLTSASFWEVRDRSCLPQLPHRGLLPAHHPQDPRPPNGNAFSRLFPVPNGRTSRHGSFSAASLPNLSTDRLVQGYRPSPTHSLLCRASSPGGLGGLSLSPPFFQRDPDSDLWPCLLLFQCRTFLRESGGPPGLPPKGSTPSQLSCLAHRVPGP